MQITPRFCVFLVFASLFPATGAELPDHDNKRSNRRGFSFDELKRKSRDKQCIPKKKHVLELIPNENVIEFVEVTEIKVAQLEIIKTIFSTFTETKTFKHPIHKSTKTRTHLATTQKRSQSSSIKSRSKKSTQTTRPTTSSFTSVSTLKSTSSSASPSTLSSLPSSLLTVSTVLSPLSSTTTVVPSSSGLTTNISNSASTLALSSTILSFLTSSSVVSTQIFFNPPSSSPPSQIRSISSTSVSTSPSPMASAILSFTASSIVSVTFLASVSSTPSQSAPLSTSGSSSPSFTLSSIAPTISSLTQSLGMSILALPPTSTISMALQTTVATSSRASVPSTAVSKSSVQSLRIVSVSRFSSTALRTTATVLSVSSISSSGPVNPCLVPSLAHLCSSAVPSSIPSIPTSIPSASPAIPSSISSIASFPTATFLSSAPSLPVVSTLSPSESSAPFISSVFSAPISSISSHTSIISSVVPPCLMPPTDLSDCQRFSVVPTVNGQAMCVRNDGDYASDTNVPPSVYTESLIDLCNCMKLCLANQPSCVSFQFFAGSYGDWDRALPFGTYCELYASPFKPTTPLDCSIGNAGYMVEFVSQWNIITSPVPCTWPAPSIDAPPSPQNSFNPPVCGAGSIATDWCGSFSAFTEYGPGCLRADTSTNMITQFTFFEGNAGTVFEGNGGRIAPSIVLGYGPCECMQSCGELFESDGCVAIEIVFAYRYDEAGTMVWWCNLYSTEVTASTPMTCAPQSLVWDPISVEEYNYNGDHYDGGLFGPCVIPGPL